MKYNRQTPLILQRVEKIDTYTLGNVLGLSNILYREITSSSLQGQKTSGILRIYTLINS